VVVEEPLLGEVRKVLFQLQQKVVVVTVDLLWEVMFAGVRAVDLFAGALFVEATEVVPFAEEASVVL
jgi:hypothetical protein